MKSSKLMSLLVVSYWCNGALAAGLPHRVVEDYPERVQASIEIYQRQLEATAANGSFAPFYVVVRQIQRWKPGASVRVAFNGGNDALYAEIRDAASAWTVANGANLKLVFTDANGRYLKWTTSDQSYKAEIRISFVSQGENRGYWSMVGTDSVTPALFGGGPNQASMNLDGFDTALSSDWRAVVMHEFGHALGFHHEHQSPVGGCDFRFQDDPGYVASLDELGWYTTDANGRRPGLYTYLGGKANYWSRPKVDANLGALPNGSAFLTSAFDRNSIMKYFFDAFMFIGGDQSPCYTPSENLVLSALDLEGARRVYPRDDASINSINNDLADILQQVRASPRASPQLREQVGNRLKTEMGHE